MAAKKKPYRKPRSKTYKKTSTLNQTLVRLPLIGRVTIGAVLLIGFGYWAVKKWDINVPIINPKKTT
jgi:hypothetical protein